MTIPEMLMVVNNEVGIPIVKGERITILANPYKANSYATPYKANPCKFIREGDEYVIYRNDEKTGMTEVFRTTDEDKACRVFIELARAEEVEC